MVVGPDRQAEDGRPVVGHLVHWRPRLEVDDVLVKELGVPAYAGVESLDCLGVPVLGLVLEHLLPVLFSLLIWVWLQPPVQHELVSLAFN